MKTQPSEQPEVGDLQESAELFRQIVDLTPQILWVTRADGSLEYVNQRWIDYSGLDHAATADREQRVALFHPDDRDELLQGWAAAMAAGESFEVEARMQGKDGAFRWFLIRIVPLRDEAGRVLKWFGSSTDIHAQKQEEADTRFLAELGERIRLGRDPGELLWTAAQWAGEHLQVSRCFFCEIDEAADRWTVHRDFRGDPELSSIAGVYPLSMYPSAIIEIGRAGRVLAVSDTARDPRTAAVYESSYQPHGNRAFIGVPLLRDGHWVAVAAAFSDRPREWAPREVALLETVAERTWNAIEKLRLDAELRASQEMLQAALDGGRLGVWSWDPSRSLVTADARVLELFGLEPASFTGAVTEIFDRVHPEDRSTVERALQQAQLPDVAYYAEFRVCLPDGQMRWLAGAGRTRNGSVYGVNSDITERKEMEEALRRADRRKDEFLAMLAHELRNPLAPIRNAAQVLKLVGPVDAHQQWAREVIERQTQHLTRLVDDLLDVSRITLGKIQLARATLDLETILQRAVEASRPLIEARRHQLTLALPPEPVRLEGDLTRLVQVVGNLLNNAAKYTEEGGQIRVEAAREEEEAILRVCDNGMGVPADLLPHVFDLFTQADRSLDRSQGGLGIGLTLVRQLVELHGGRVEARSEGFGRGSEFVVRLPALPSAAAASAETGAGEPGLSAARGLKVLIVEDNVDSAEMMSFMLRLVGHEVRTVYSGPEALEVARAFAPQAVLCDIGLPGMNGYEVAARLREQPAFQRTLLIALTGYGQEEARQRAQEAGFDHHLVKPVEPDALAALLASLRP